MDYDVFICHASEDKEAFVAPLAHALQDGGVRVWYDSFELQWGDKLRGKIDQGLSSSRYGLVVLSKAFFEKNWPKTELDALVARQNNEGKKVVLPIWHGVGPEEVSQFSSILASTVAIRSSDGISYVVARVLGLLKKDELPKAKSVFQVNSNMGLREQCLEIIRQGDVIAWRKLVKQVSEPIPDQLKQWKSEGERALQTRKPEEWKHAVTKAADICLPGFMPMLAAIDVGKIEYWRDSLGILRSLAIVEREMGGGIERVNQIGESLLFVAGALGLAIAVDLKQLSLIDEWLNLPMPISQDRGECSWITIRYAHHPPAGIEAKRKNPFGWLLEVSELPIINKFFPNKDLLIDNLYMVNLLASLVELRNCTKDNECMMSLTEGKKQLLLDVWPIWCTMDTERFKQKTLELFGSGKGVIDFAAPGKSVLRTQFWTLWKKWRRVCVGYWDDQSGSGLFNGRFISLPGEPAEQES